MTYTVTFRDIDNSQEREEWAIKNCKTFAYRLITEASDVSDVSNMLDTVYEFYFGCEKDAMWFRLYWG